MKNENGNTSSSGGSTESWEELLKTSMGPVMQSWEEFLKSAGMFNVNQACSRGEDSLYTNFKMFQKCISGLGKGEGFDHFKQMFDVSPDIALGFSNSCLQGFISVMEHGGQWIERRGKSLSLVDMQELDRELLAKLSELYEEEFKK